MKHLKKLACMLLVAAMLFGILPLGVFAETQITQIDVTVEQFPVAWKAPKNLPAPSVGADSGYRITNFEWYDVTYDTGSPMGNMDLFEKDHDYVLYIYLEPLAGYAFAGSPSVAVNGSASLVASCEIGSSGGFFRTRPVTATDPNAPTAITEVNITGFRTPYVGQTAGANLASVDVPEGAHYEITSLDWQEAENGSFLEVSDDFAAGNEYYVCFVLSPAEGYAFSENCTVLINGAADQVDGDYTRWNADGTLTFYSVDLEPTVPQVVARIDLTGFVMPQVGQTAGGNLASLGVPAGAGYTVTEAIWRSGGEEMAASDCFTANTTCYICFTVALAEGYVFDVDEGAVVYINGDTSLVDSDYTEILTDNTLQCYTVDLTPEDGLIEEVSINGFTLPQPGDTPAQNLAGLSVPAGAHYSIVNAHWFHFKTGDSGSSMMNGDDVFTENEWAYLAIVFSPANGYCFDEDALPTVNGLAPLALNYSYVSNDGTLHAVSTGFTVGSEPGVDTAIGTVAVNGFTVPQPGDTASENLALLSLPEGAHYYIGASGWFDEAAFKTMSGSDVFDANKTYSLWVRLEAYTGYTLSSATVPYVNGGTDLVDYANCDYFDSEDFYKIWTIIVQPGVGPIEYVPIEEINISGFTVPQAGDTVSANLALLSLPSGAHYYIGDVGSIGWYDEAASKTMSDSDVFDANKTYSLWVQIYANPGYTLSNETVPYVNGGTDFVDYNYCSYYNSSGYYQIWTVAVQPGAATEDVLIEEVNINGFTVPQPGDTVSENFALLSVPDGAHYYVGEWRWYDGTNGDLMADSGVFDADRTYYLWVRIYPNNGYALSSETVAHLNGEAALVDSKFNSYRSDIKAFSFCSVDVQPGVEPVEDVLIEEININGFTVPQPGDTVSENLALLSVPDGAHYYITELRWQDGETGMLMNASDVFVANETYFLYVQLMANPGYALSSATVAYLNGGTALVDSEYNGYNSDTKKFSFYSVDVQLDAAVEGVLIEEVNVSGFAAPTVGQTVGEYVASLSVPEGAPYEIKSAEWYVGGDFDPMDASESFEALLKYFMRLDIQPKDGYCFVKAALPTVLFDGSGSYVDSRYTGVNSAGALVCYSIEFVLDPAPGTLPVSEVAINGYALPRVGQTAGDNLASVTVPDGAPYTVSDMYWMNSGTRTMMAASDVFVAGRTYFLIIKFLHADGFYFDRNNGLTFLVNGSDEYSRGCGQQNSVLYCYTTDYKVPAVQRGDINADGSVSITDVTALLNILADSGAADLAICDLDGSGSVSITDVTALLNILAGKE